MTFQSVLYILLLIVVWLISWPIRRPVWRQCLFLAVSVMFYASWNPFWLLVLLGSSVANYAWLSLLRRRPRAGLLWVGLGGNILLLGFYKYAADPLANLISPSALLLMPVGLSFYTFQAISALIDAYRGALDEQSTLLEFALYMAFWPTVLSGPINRLGDLTPQFRSTSRPSYDDVTTGVRRILVGLFFKVVLADTLAQGINLGEGVDVGFDRLAGGWSGLDVWFLAIGYGLQLFFDFAGYSHVAVGSARLFGIHLRENFAHPYLGTTPADFWNRWHMSLSTWIRDYLFFPLATLRRGFWWRNLTVIFSMGLIGLWHGSGATFLVWGLWHGLLLAGHRVIQRWRREQGLVARGGWVAAETFLSWGVTFSLVSLGWVFFRAPSLQQAGAMLTALLDIGSYRTMSLRPNFYILVVLVFLGYFGFIGLRALLDRWRRPAWVESAAWLLSPVYYATLILAVVVWSEQASTFVYLQF